MTTQDQTFEPFATELAYIHVNEKLVDKVVRQLKGVKNIRLLDIAAGTGLMTKLTWEKSKPAGAHVCSVLLDIDLPALKMIRTEERADTAHYVYASASDLPLKPGYDAAIFANSLHLLDHEMKIQALAEVNRVLDRGGVLAMNSTFRLMCTDVSRLDRSREIR